MELEMEREADKLGCIVFLECVTEGKLEHLKTCDLLSDDYVNQKVQKWLSVARLLVPEFVDKVFEAIERKIAYVR